MLYKGEYQNAFAYLSKRLKPLESKQNDSEEFRDLCYLLACKSLSDIPHFKNWDGKNARFQILITGLKI